MQFEYYRRGILATTIPSTYQPNFFGFNSKIPELIYDKEYSRRGILTTTILPIPSA